MLTWIKGYQNKVLTWIKGYKYVLRTWIKGYLYRVLNIECLISLPGGCTVLQGICVAKQPVDMSDTCQAQEAKEVQPGNGKGLPLAPGP